MRWLIANLLVLLALLFLAATAIGLVVEDGIVALGLNRSAILVWALLVLGLAWAAAFALLGSDYEDVWIVRFSFWLFPGLAGLRGIGPGPDIGLTGAELDRRARTLRWTKRIGAVIVALMALGPAYLMVAWGKGWTFHRSFQHVETCIAARAEAVGGGSGAEAICRAGLAELDRLLPLAEAGKLVDPDAFWIDRASLILRSGGGLCADIRAIRDSLGRMKTPERFDRYEPFREIVDDPDGVYAGLCDRAPVLPAPEASGARR